MNNAPLDNPRLNLADRHEIDLICAALNCGETDIYQAVAIVRDSVHDLRRYIGKVLEQRASERGMTTLSDLPLLWQSVRANEPH